MALGLINLALSTPLWTQLDDTVDDLGTAFANAGLQNFVDGARVNYTSATLPFALPTGLFIRTFFDTQSFSVLSPATDDWTTPNRDPSAAGGVTGQDLTFSGVMAKFNWAYKDDAGQVGRPSTADAYWGLSFANSVVADGAPDGSMNTVSFAFPSGFKTGFRYKDMVYFVPGSYLASWSSWIEQTDPLTMMEEWVQVGADTLSLGDSDIPSGHFTFQGVQIPLNNHNALTSVSGDITVTSVSFFATD